MTPIRRTARGGTAQGVSVASVVTPGSDPAALAVKATFLRRLELDVNRRLDGLVSGEYLAVNSGPGTEPAGARPYSPGDDARRIDWNLTARALTAHIRTTEADRELETIVLADRSASLDFGTAEHEKRVVVLATVAAFGFLTVREGNRFGVLVAGGDDLVRLPTRHGRVGVLAALSTLYETPRHQAPPDPHADLAAGLARLERTQSRRGQLVVVSDFLDPSDWLQPLQRLALRHQLVTVHVTDPRELTLPTVGMLEVVDAETGRRLAVQTSAALRSRYETAARSRHDAIRRKLLTAGAEYLHLSTDRDWLVDVVDFVARRRRRRPPRIALRGRQLSGVVSIGAGAPDGAGER